MGFQPGDWPATIDRETQQRLTVDAILLTLAEAERRAARSVRHVFVDNVLTA
jgi:hypothetical protein